MTLEKHKNRSWGKVEIPVFPEQRKLPPFYKESKDSPERLNYFLPKVSVTKSPYNLARSGIQ